MNRYELMFGAISVAMMWRVFRPLRRATSTKSVARGPGSTGPLGFSSARAPRSSSGRASRCSWYTQGTGTFLGGAGSSPDVGEAGREERVAELRLETVFPAEKQDDVVSALRSAHPYEEPAFDIYERVS